MIVVALLSAACDPAGPNYLGLSRDADGHAVVHINTCGRFDGVVSVQVADGDIKTAEFGEVADAAYWRIDAVSPQDIAVVRIGEQPRGFHTVVDNVEAINESTDVVVVFFDGHDYADVIGLKQLQNLPAGNVIDFDGKVMTVSEFEDCPDD